LIDKQDLSYTSDSFNKVKYEFKLLYRSSRDGLNATTFHQKCDNITKTLVVGKIHGSNQIIGGYNPLNWNGKNEWKRTTESFIFNINNKNDITNEILFSYVNNNDYNHAIWCNSSYLPTFGYCFSIHFTLSGDIIGTDSRTYNDISIVEGSKFDELEVFQIVHKI
jgi:hypothetical protein